MAVEKETAEEKNRRLFDMLQNALTELFDRKTNNVKSFGESALIVTWKAGAVDAIRIEDSASIR